MILLEKAVGRARVGCWPRGWQGLTAGVWTENISRPLTTVKRIEAGTAWVNTYRAVSCMVPFGGYKKSGVGRENGMDMVE